MRLRSWRGTTQLSESTKASFPWARVLLIVAILGIGAYLILPSLSYVQADALVQGQLVPVTPLYRVRLDQLLVGCNDRVTAGQRLAVVSNFLVQADYERQYQESVSQLSLSKITLDEAVAEARNTEATMLAKYQASAQTAERLGDTLQSYTKAYRGGAVSRVDWEAKQGEYQSAVDVAQSDREAWLRSEQAVERIGADQGSKIASDQTISSQAQSLAARVGSEPLLAPVSGYIVNCVDRPQNVVNPSTPIFNIFNPDRAYVLAYFNPNDVAKIHLNEPVDVTVAGISQRLTGRVGAIYPDLSKLPPQLTRFFWQHVQWSEYRPVRVLLDRIPADERAQLYYGAQAHVRISLHDDSKATTANASGSSAP